MKKHFTLLFLLVALLSFSGCFSNSSDNEPALVLSDLKVVDNNDNSLELSPEFDPGQLYYEARVSNEVSQVTITAIGTSLTDQITGGSVQILEIGENEFQVSITNPATNLETTYTVSVVREYPIEEIVNGSFDDLRVVVGTNYAKLNITFNLDRPIIYGDHAATMSDVSIDAKINNTTAHIDGFGMTAAMDYPDSFSLSLFNKEDPTKTYNLYFATDDGLFDTSAHLGNLYLVQGANTIDFSFQFDVLKRLENEEAHIDNFSMGGYVNGVPVVLTDLEIFVIETEEDTYSFVMTGPNDMYLEFEIELGY